MYTTRNYNDDLYQICSTHFVRMKLLKDVMENRLAKSVFIETLTDENMKSEQEVAEILSKLGAIQYKIHQNGGRLDEDPVMRASQLRKENRLEEAYCLLLPVVQANRDNEEAAIGFGWIMYDYLKRSENDIQAYLSNVAILNDNTSFTFRRVMYGEEDSITVLKNSILWSLRRVVRQHETYADRLLPEIIRFCSGRATFIEQRVFSRNTQSASRLLIKDLLPSLNDENYLRFMDMIGFSWFDQEDYSASSFVNEAKETIPLRPLAEVMLNRYAKKLIELPLTEQLEQKINDFIEILEKEIAKNPTFEWLPYYKVKLLMKAKRNNEAFQEVVHFARTKSKDFWVWTLISELVEEEQAFNCLCAGLLCKTKPDMIVSLQEKIIPYLVKRELLANAKYELDQLIQTRMQKWNKVPPQLLEMKNEAWYSQATAAKNRDQLKDYAEQAEMILYETLPEQNIFITYVNQDKGVINFAYVNGTIKKGYFYMDAVEPQQWQVEKIFRVKMLADKKREELYKLYAIAPGDETYVEHFIKEDSGCVEKESHNAFAFVDDVYISPNLVNEHQLSPYDNIAYIKKRTFNKKRKTWGWAVVSITSVQKNPFFDFDEEMEV